ncbi:MAG: hypothetical protein R6V41_12535 [Desulfobacteraceae bacterium]
MEDISRELEREIKSYTKPSKARRKTDKRLILVDDFGKMKSADWIRRAAKLFFYLSLALGAAACLYYYLYSELKAEKEHLNARLTKAEKRIEKLTSRNEHLMAKVVMSGMELTDMEDQTSQFPETDFEDQGSSDDKESEEKPEDRRAEAENEVQPDENAGSEKSDGSQINENMVDIENFRIAGDTGSGDMLVRFKIQNMTEEPGDITGHIFILLHPKKGDAEDRLVVPTSSLDNGIPENPDKGQFFSIAHFKPVKFRVRNTSGPDFFSHAEVVVFNRDGKLVLKKKMPMKTEQQ